MIVKVNKEGKFDLDKNLLYKMSKEYGTNEFILEPIKQFTDGTYTAKLIPNYRKGSEKVGERDSGKSKRVGRKLQSN